MVGCLLLVNLFSSRFQHLDSTATLAITGDASTEIAMKEILDRITGTALLVIVGLVALRELRRSRWQAAVCAVVVPAGANATTQLLKYVSGAALPSGHTTAAVSLVFVLVLTSLREVRPVSTALGSAAATVTATALVVGRFHEVADVLAAPLVCLAWAVAVLGALHSDIRLTPGRWQVVPALVGGALAGLLLILLGVRPAAADRWLGVGTAAAIGLLMAWTTATFAALAERFERPGQPGAQAEQFPNTVRWP